MLNIFIDADACPVKEETYRVADRCQLKVILVANQPMRIPEDLRYELKVVKGNFDAADDWIVENVSRGDIVITSDILLADRCLKKQARVLGPKGEEFTEDNIGGAIAMRELMGNIRSFGEVKGGPSAMNKNHRSNYLAKLDQIIQQLKKS
ncbi:MAG: YaiI/YqxD family protein [Bdellovibrio sp.]|nr:YaiI/YqxD family protein [Bdellovibrio sp.]